MLELPPELWERIFCYVPKSEVLCLRLVCQKFLRAIPESYMRVRQLDLSVVQRDPRTEALPTFINKVLKTVLSRKQNGGQTQSLVLTPHIEFIESMEAPPSLMRQLWKFLQAFIWLDSTAYEVRTKIIGQIVSSLPHIRTVAIVESPVLGNITGDPWKSIIPLRCSYVDILWARFSEQLTDLEIWVATETVWPTYCPGGATELPNLRILRIRWGRDIHSCVALRLASKAPNLEELAVFQPPSSVSNVLPHDPQLLSHLRVFRWVDNTTVYSVDPNIARFFQTFSSQLKDISLVTSRLPGIENILPLEKLDTLRIDLSTGSLFTHREILLRRIETTNHKLRALVLQCVTWGTGDVQRLFQALGRLPTIHDLCLFLPTYSNTWLVDIAKSTTNLESLRWVSVGPYTVKCGTRFTTAVPFRRFADEVQKYSFELSRWKLRDLTICGQDGDSSSEPIFYLLKEIAKVVPTIFSFYGAGHMRAPSSGWEYSTGFDKTTIGPSGIGENQWSSYLMS